MLHRRLHLLVPLLCLLAVATADEKSCTIHNGDDFFDLNKLSASKDYEFTSPGGHGFILNVCKSVSHERWNLRNVSHPERVGAFIRRDHGDFSIGEANTTLQMKTGHPLLLLDGGSVCPKSEFQASTAIQFVCDTSVFAAGKPELIAQLPDDEDTACSFFIEWRTHFACPHGERGFWSALFVILFSTCLVLAMLYIVFMTVYNRYALHLRGFDQIPAPPRQLTRAFSAFGKFLYFLSKMLGLGEDDGAGASGGRRRRGLNPTSHHWSDEALGVGGSRFGSGARLDEEEAMLGGGEYEEDVDDLGDVGAAGAGRHVNPWHGSLAAEAGREADPAGAIRL